jgi:dolichol kinase
LQGSTRRNWTSAGPSAAPLFYWLLRCLGFGQPIDLWYNGTIVAWERGGLPGQAHRLLEMRGHSPFSVRVSLRKPIHLAMAVVPASGWLISYPLALLCSGALLLVSLVVETARRCWPEVNRLLWQIIPSTFRQGEERRILGSTWFALGMSATLLLFGRDAGGTAVLFLTWGDPAAELVGRRWGTPGKAKTAAGSVGCLAACLFAGLVGIGLGGLSPWAVLAGGVVATLVERLSPPPDDNLWMPTLSGLAILAVQRLVDTVAAVSLGR